jgi:hypothetical protein
MMSEAAAKSHLKTDCVRRYAVLRLGQFMVIPGGTMTDEMNDRRTARRFHMALPLQVRFMNNGTNEEKSAQTRDVSFRGVYFLTDSLVKTGSALELVLTLPQQITLAGDVRIRCYGNVTRVEERENSLGVAARINRYEFLPTAA